MNRAPSSLIIGCMLTSLWLVASCTQDEGDSCQINSDCASPLICCDHASTARSVCGSAKDSACTDPKGMNNDKNDAGTTEDASTADASTSSEDAGPMMSVDDAGGGDGG